MVEETLSSAPPTVGRHPGAQGKTPPPTDGQTAAKKSTGSRSAGQPITRQQRLKLHLIIGLVMSLMVIAGYVFLGPEVNAAGAARPQVVDAPDRGPVTANHSQSLGLQAADSNAVANDLAAMQAEMAELTRQMNTIQAGGALVDTGTASFPAGQAASNGTSGVNNDPLQARLDQLMAQTHAMIATMNSLDGQTGTAGSQPGAGSHNH